VPEDHPLRPDDRPLDDEGLDEEDEDDPNNPAHPDHDLSESMPYSAYEPPPKPWYIRRWVLLIVAVFTIAALMLPYMRNLFIFP
jgi:hypothetical protein